MLKAHHRLIAKRERVLNPGRLFRNPVHALIVSRQTGLLERKFRYLFAYHFDKLGAGAELVEGLRATCDTVSEKRANRWRLRTSL
jgi:hypothetical protein